MRALSGLTPALARRLQRQLLAHLPPAAARELRRTLSLSEPARARSSSSCRSGPATPGPDPPPADCSAPTSPEPKSEPATYESPTSYCTLPRLRRPSGSAPERPLLSKYLSPTERALSLDGPGAESGSLLSEPSYAAAYGARARPVPSVDPPRKRISRFLRADFFDSPPDENVYIKHKKEKELETQKILKEIREKKNKSLESSLNVKNSIDGDVPYSFKDDSAYPRKCLSPVAILTPKERSRSNTPFFPSLDNIKESAIDASLSRDTKPYKDFSELKQKSQFNESSVGLDSRLTRPKSYPVKNLDPIEEPAPSLPSDTSTSKEIENKENNLQRESKLIRPKSYPASSPSPEKVYISRNIKKDLTSEKPPPPPAKINTPSPEVKNDVEVSFSITLPKKKVLSVTKGNSLKNSETLDKTVTESSTALSVGESLDLKKYKVINSDNTSEQKEHKMENGTAIVDGGGEKNSTEETNTKIADKTSKMEDVKNKSSESEAPSEKKGTIKKKIIKKVSSKSKTDVVNSQDTGETKTATVKKKVTKKVKEKSSEDGIKPTVTKKKSVLQSIGHKLEKFASNKSASPEKVADNNISAGEAKKDSGKQSRAAREHSVPASAEPPSESKLIKRAVTITDVAALENQTPNLGKTTVSKVLGLFKKFEPKEKTPKPLVEKSNIEHLESSTDISNKNENPTEEDISESLDIDKPRRPTSLLLNGLGRKKYGKTTSDSFVTTAAVDDETTSNKKENEPKNLKNTLKLDFSRLPRVKKIVPTNPVIEPQYIITSLDQRETEDKTKFEKNGTVPDGNTVVNNSDTISRSRSRSRSTISNSENKSDLSVDYKTHDMNLTSPSENSVHHPFRNHESLSPEKEDIVDRIRRKSFYSRFNEKKQRRKSNLVGPGAAEYDPLARIHSPPAEPKFDSSPTSPPVASYDLSPGYSIASDLSPSTERYRSLLTDLPVNTRSNLRFDNYGLNDKIDTYRSLDRSEVRKYPGSRSYLEHSQPASLGAHRYSRTQSLLDGEPEESSLPHRYNRTLSMYSPGNYATYRPKRTRNSAIILKESEKEPSPENILDKIRQRKNISISVTRKPDLTKDPLPRSSVSPKGEGDCAECSEKVD